MTGAPDEYSRVNLSSDPIYRYVRVTKPGSVPGTSEQELIDQPWLQRLRRIHQLQSAWWVFPTAEHSRFQHSLGAMHLAGEWARHLYPSLAAQQPDTPSEALVSETLRLAGLLHDVGHGPFGHFFDEIYLSRWGLDHEAVGRQLITGELAPLIADVQASPETDFAAGERIDPRWVAELISAGDLPGFEPPGWLNALKPVMVGSFSADNMDYVPRDAYTCGVASGAVDVARILHYSFISTHGLTLHNHAAEALFMFLTARLYLYNQVYFHRTVRRIDLQLRDIFGPTMDELLGGNPLDDLAAYQRLNEWALLSEVDRWSDRAPSVRRRELGRAWADIVARKLHWQLVYSSYLEAREMPQTALEMGRAEFAERIRERLRPELRRLEFEVDVAAQASRAFSPIPEGQDIIFYDALQGTYEQSRVLDLFRRLPVRMAIFRIFAKDGSARVDLRRAAEEVLTH